MMKIEKYLKQSPVFLLNSLYEKIVTDVNHQLKGEGINFLQGLILTALVFDEGEKITPSALAETLQTSRGNVSHAVSHLEYRGLVKRTVNAADARQFHLALKPEGRKLAYKLIKFYDRLQDAFEEGLGVAACERLTRDMAGLRNAYEHERRPSLRF